MDQGYSNPGNTQLNPNIFEQVRDIASDILSVPASTIEADSSPDNVETWDSIQHLNFVLALEERFNFQLSPEEIERMRNVGEIAKLVENKLQTR
jgi:acyl carrier protein